MNLDRLASLANRARRCGVHPPQNTGDWYKIANQDGDRAELFIYGVIGSDFDEGDVTASSFVRDLRAISAPAIDLHLNSPGGTVWDGVTIFSALKNHAATVDVSVDGIAASAASFVAMAGDSIVIEKPARMMIHNAHGLVIGNADDMTEMATLLAELDGTIADIYAERAGGDVAEWRAAMSAETWYSSDKAVAAGLADRVANDNTTSESESRAGQMIRARARVTLGKG